MLRMFPFHKAVMVFTNHVVIKMFGIWPPWWRSCPSVKQKVSSYVPLMKECLHRSPNFVQSYKYGNMWKHLNLWPCASYICPERGFSYKSVEWEHILWLRYVLTHWCNCRISSKCMKYNDTIMYGNIWLQQT